MAEYDPIGGPGRAWFDWDCPLYADLFPDLASSFRQGDLTWEASVAEALSRLGQLVGGWLSSEERIREDVLQEMLVRLHLRGTASYCRHEAALRYARSFARNIARERRRKHWREVSATVELIEQQIDEDADVVHLAATNELVAIIRLLAERLSAKQRRALSKSHPLLNPGDNAPMCMGNNEYVDRHRALAALRRLLECGDSS